MNCGLLLDRSLSGGSKQLRHLCLSLLLRVMSSEVAWSRQLRALFRLATSEAGYGSATLPIHARRTDRQTGVARVGFPRPRPAGSGSTGRTSRTVRLAGRSQGTSALAACRGLCCFLLLTTMAESKLNVLMCELAAIAARLRAEMSHRWHCASNIPAT